MTGQIDQQDPEFELSLYLDGQLSARQARRLEARLEADPHLREQLRLYRSLNGHVEQLAERVPPGADLDAQRADVMDRLERRALLQPAQPGRSRFRAAIGAMAAAAAVVVVATVGTWVALRNEPTGRSRGTVTANVVPPARRAAGPEQLAMELRRLDWNEVPVSTGQPGPVNRRPPAGTVVVSFGHPQPPEPRPTGRTPMSID